MTISNNIDEEFVEAYKEWVRLARLPYALNGSFSTYETLWVASDEGGFKEVRHELPQNKIAPLKSAWDRYVAVRDMLITLSRNNVVYY